MNGNASRLAFFDLSLYKDYYNLEVLLTLLILISTTGQYNFSTLQYKKITLF